MNNFPQIFALLPSGMEWLWIVLLVLLLFGGAKLPALAKGLGQSIREFKKATSEDADDDDETEKKSSKKKSETKAETDAKPNGNN